MKFILIFLLTSLWTIPVYAESFQSECEYQLKFKTEQQRDNFDSECLEQIIEEERRDKIKSANKDVDDIMIIIKSFMLGVNKSGLTEDFAIFIFSMKTELVKAGFTEDQAMTFLSFSGQLLYQSSKDK